MKKRRKAKPKKEKRENYKMTKEVEMASERTDEQKVQEKDEARKRPKKEK